MVRGPDGGGESGRCHAVRQGAPVICRQGPRQVGIQFGLYAPQTHPPPFSHLARAGVRHGRSVGGGSHRSGQHRQSQSGLSLLVDGGVRVVQVPVGGTRQVQDRQGRHGGLREDPETQRRAYAASIVDGRREGILQQYPSGLDEVQRHCSLLDER